MSQWRREASERLPELQRIIASKIVDSPMMMWIELNQEFERLCETGPPPLDLLKRIWGYCEWCLAQGTSDIQTAAALGFCEHLIDTPKRRAILPKIMKRSDFLDLRNLLEYHNTSAEVDECLNTVWMNSPMPERMPSWGGAYLRTLPQKTLLTYLTTHWRATRRTAVVVFVITLTTVPILASREWRSEFPIAFVMIGSLALFATTYAWPFLVHKCESINRRLGSRPAPSKHWGIKFFFWVALFALPFVIFDNLIPSLNPDLVFGVAACTGLISGCSHALARQNQKMPNKMLR